jgi:hypothetical protein
MKAEKIARTIFKGYKGYKRGGVVGAMRSIVVDDDWPWRGAPYPSAAEYVDEPDFELYCVC